MFTQNVKTMSEDDSQPPNEAVDGGRLDADGRDALETLRALELGRVRVIAVGLRIREQVFQNLGQVFILDWTCKEIITKLVITCIIIMAETTLSLI